MQPFQSQLTIAMFALGGFGMYLLFISIHHSTLDGSRTNAMVGGCVSLGLATALLMVGVFAYRGRK